MSITRKPYPRVGDPKYEAPAKATLTHRGGHLWWGHIYAAQAPSGGPIKIGVSMFPEIRANNVFAAAGKDEPPILLTVLRGAGRLAETELHRILRPWRTDDGEWYEPDPAVLAVLAAFKAGRDLAVRND